MGKIIKKGEWEGDLVHEDSKNRLIWIEWNDGTHECGIMRYDFVTGMIAYNGVKMSEKKFYDWVEKG